jgi:hypothetical protein
MAVTRREFVARGERTPPPSLDALALPYLVSGGARLAGSRAAQPASRQASALVMSVPAEACAYLIRSMTEQSLLATPAVIS